MHCGEQSYISKGWTGEAVSFFPTLIGLQFTNDSSSGRKANGPPTILPASLHKNTLPNRERAQLLPVLHAYLSPCHCWSRMQRSLFAWGCTFQLMVRVTLTTTSACTLQNSGAVLSCFSETRFAWKLCLDEENRLWLRSTEIPGAIQALSTYTVCIPSSCNTLPAQAPTSRHTVPAINSVD